MLTQNSRTKRYRIMM